MFFKVGLAKHDLIILLISFVGVIVLITGTLSPTSEESEEYSTTELIVPILCLIIMPFNAASINLFLR